MSGDRSQLLAVLLLVTLSLCTLPRQVPATTTEFEITVPEATKVKGEDSYICTTLALPDKPYKLVGVEPLGRKEVVHHILLFGEPCPQQQLSKCLNCAVKMLLGSDSWHCWHVMSTDLSTAAALALAPMQGVTCLM